MGVEPNVRTLRIAAEEVAPVPGGKRNTNGDHHPRRPWPDPANTIESSAREERNKRIGADRTKGMRVPLPGQGCRHESRKITPHEQCRLTPLVVAPILWRSR